MTWAGDRKALAVPAFALIVAALLAVLPQIFNDGDTTWHLAAGRLMLDSGAVPAVDPFSYTVRGRAWTAHEWLAEVTMASVHAAASWGGLAVLTGGAIGATLLLLGSELDRRMPVQRAIAVLVLVAGVLAPFMLARPHVLAWPLLAGWTMILLRARERNRAPPFAAALLMIVWANMHASFIIGLALVGVFALEAVIAGPDRRGALLRWAAFGVAALGAALLTPHGVQGLLYPFQVSGMTALPLIVEWRRTALALDWLFVAGVSASVLWLLARRPPVPPIRLLLLAGLVAMAILHARHQPLVAILGALILAEPLGRSASPSTLARSAAVFAIGLVLIAIVRISVPLQRHDSASDPITAIGRLPPSLRARPVMNSYGFGGPLILAGIAPYIDGRGDMYGDAFMIEHQRIMDGEPAAFDRAVRRWQIGWTMLEPGTPLVARLDASPGWRRVYADEWAVVHVRQNGSNPSVIPAKAGINNR